MFFCTIMFLLFVSPIYTADQRSGFAQQYLNTNYTPMIVETRPMTIKQLSSKLSCLAECLNENDCSLVVFNPTDGQCALYNLFPVVEQELLPDDNIIVFVFQHTIQLVPSVSNASWLLSRLNATIPTIVLSVQSPRCLAMDSFGYLLNLQSASGATYVDRYDRTSLSLVKRTTLPLPPTAKGMLTYYNNMLFISPYNLTSVFVYDHVNFCLLTTITCGSNIGQPRDLAFIESRNLMIMISAQNNKLLFFHINSPTNYTCLNTSIPIPGTPQAIITINDSLFYVTSWVDMCVYGLQFDGLMWNQFIFANITQAIGGGTYNVAHLHIDNFERRWVMVPNYGIVVYDRWGTYLGKWRVGVKPFDIFITYDYRLVISDIGNSMLTLYDPQLNL